MTIQEIISNSGFTHGLAVLSGFASNWLLSFLKHSPAPKKTNIWRGAIFDATQDAVKNNERIGERRDKESEGSRK